MVVNKHQDPLFSWLAQENDKLCIRQGIASYSKEGTYLSISIFWQLIGGSPFPQYIAFHVWNPGSTQPVALIPSLILLYYIIQYKYNHGSTANLTS